MCDRNRETEFLFLESSVWAGQGDGGAGGEGRVRMTCRLISCNAKRRISEGPWNLAQIIFILPTVYYLLSQKYFPELLLCI